MPMNYTSDVGGRSVLFDDDEKNAIREYISRLQQLQLSENQPADFSVGVTRKQFAQDCASELMNLIPEGKRQEFPNLATVCT